MTPFLADAPPAFVPAQALLATVYGSLGALDWGGMVSTGEAALALCARRRFSAVFADFAALRDGMSGPQLARRLRAAFPALPVFLLTERPDPMQRMWALRCGATALVLRDVDDLLERVGYYD